tara:strand:- start:1056 stop:1538 length:483 start_codon:yes stop_codon:yes gene_type:complete
MSTKFVIPLVELKARIDAAIEDSENPLYSSRVIVGDRDDVFGDDNFTTIFLSVQDGSLILDPTAVAKYNFTADVYDITFKINLMAPKKEDETNEDYKVSDTSGPLYLLGALLDAVTTDSGSDSRRRLHLVAAAEGLPDISWTYDRIGSFKSITVLFKARI